MFEKLLTRVSGSPLLSAFAWSTTAFAIGQIIRIFGNLVMTRILAPEMFGIVGLVMLVQMMLALFMDFGLRTVVVQSQRGEQPELLNTIWTLEILRGIAIWIFSVLCAVAIWGASKWSLLPSEAAWSAPELPLVMSVATFAAAIGGFQSTSLMLATRKLDAKTVAAVDLGSQIAGLVVMIAVGYMTGSIWSLVVGGFASAVVATVASHAWSSGPRNRLCWDKPSLLEIISTGRWILLSSIVFVIASNVDRIILGGYIGAREFGIYTLALGLLTLFETMANRIFSSVCLPWLSEAARISSAELYRRLFRLRLPVDLVLVACAGFLYVTAPAIISILYDYRYQQAGEMLQILSFSLLFTRFGILNTAYVALGHADQMASVHVLKLVAAVTAMTIGVQFYGLTGGLVAVSCHSAVPVAYMLWLNRKLNLNNFGHEICVPLIAWPAGFLAGHACLAAFKFLTG